MVGPADAAADPVGGEQHDVCGHRGQAEPDGGSEPEVRRTCAARLVHNDHGIGADRGTGSPGWRPDDNGRALSMRPPGHLHFANSGARCGLFV
jgi:hypothetical protein